jgi:elongation factor P--(R)-beta-lysine ligase
MLEWYRVGASYLELMAECAALVGICQEAAGVEALSWRGHSADARCPWQHIVVDSAFREFAGIDLLATAPDPRAPDMELLAAAASRIGVPPHPGDDWEALYFRLFLETDRAFARDWGADNPL